MEDDVNELRSNAAVPTRRPERWIKQLASHLGRKAEVQEGADGAVVLVLGSGTCRMSGDGALLHLAAGAPGRRDPDRGGARPRQPPRALRPGRGPDGQWERTPERPCP